MNLPSRPRLLLATRADNDQAGGAVSVMKQTARALDALGCETRITTDLHPDVRGFDLVHAFNVWAPATALEQLRHLRSTGIPVVWSPIYLHWCEYTWAVHALQDIYGSAITEDERARRLRQFADRTLPAKGFDAWSANEVYPGFHDHLKEMLACVDHVCATSFREMQTLVQVTGSTSIPFTLTPHGVDTTYFREATPNLFRSRFGPEPFVLCVGAVDIRKNQLMLVRALKGTPLRTVLVGPSLEPGYLNVCRREGGDGLLVTGRLSPEMVASAYKAAAAHALPSFAEGAALANLEAAVSGCPMVVSNRSSEFEYFGDAPFYCNPTDPTSIRNALHLAIESGTREPHRWTVLSGEIASRYSWENTARLTLEAYQRAVQARDSSGIPGSRPRSPHTENAPSAPRTVSPPGKAGGPLPTVVWYAPVFDPGGYADEARHFVLKASRSWPLRLNPAGRNSPEFLKGMELPERTTLKTLLGTPVKSPYIHVQHIPAYALDHDPEAAWNVCRTIFETDRLPSDWVERLNRMDEVWVSTAFNRDTFRQSGVNRPIYILPQGIDTERFRPGLPPVDIQGRRGFVFLSIFEWLYRKGWDILLEAWARAFTPSDDVCLILRTYPVNVVDHPDSASVILRRIHEFLDGKLGRPLQSVAPIVVVGRPVPQMHMPRLYASADAFVLPSRGEGWGRPYMEAMACGLPVIGTGWSGNLAFMNEGNSYLIDPGELVTVDDRAEFPFYRGHKWSNPSVEHLATLMRRVFENRSEAKAKGNAAAQSVRRDWTWDHACRLLLDRLHAIAEEMPSGASRRSAPMPASTAPAAPVHTAPVPAQPLSVRWEGLQFVNHSMALVNREICLQLIDAGCDVSIINYVPEDFGPERDPRFPRIASRIVTDLSRPVDVHVRHHFDPDFTPPPDGRWVIMQPWEYGRLPEDWVRPVTTLVDEIWAPSRHVLRTFVSCGIPADRVHLVPLGVNTALFRPGAAPHAFKTDRRFKFLFVGGTIWRKGVDVLLEAYRAAFRRSDDVVLIIKELGQDTFYKGQGIGSTIQSFALDPSAPEILHFGEMVEEAAMPGFYAACDCLVHSYRAEGFGLPIIEAMACGLPVMATAGGSTDDFCTDRTAVRIPAEQRGFKHTTVRFAGGSGWVMEPNANELARLLREAYEGKLDLGRRAALALETVRTEFTWEKAGEATLARIKALVAKPVLRRLR